LALRLAEAEVSVLIGSRDPARAASVVGELLEPWPDRGLEVEGVGNKAAAEADLVVAATPWEAAVETAGELAGELRGKVVVSVANALVKQGREMLALALPRGSVAQALQVALPASKVSAACHHLPAGPLGNLDKTVYADVLVCSDHEDAKDATIALLARIEGIRPLDAGSLAAAGPIEAFTAVLATLNMRYKVRSTLNFAGLEDI